MLRNGASPALVCHVGATAALSRGTQPGERVETARRHDPPSEGGLEPTAHFGKR